MLWCVTEKLSLGELTRVQGVSQKFPIGVVNWEILSFGAGGGGELGTCSEGPQWGSGQSSRKY